MKESRRQEYWLKKGYTQEQINSHLKGERRKGKTARERSKRNNEKNKDIIKRIESDLLNKTFARITVLKISPTVDGVGCYVKYHKTFSDGSHGDFKEFIRFTEYSKKDFIKYSHY